ncbi:MAG: hypothetical protein OHK0037_01360 [Elainellaceae cyanobacterium]
MTLPNSLRALRSKPIQITRQLLVFSLKQEQFALPLTVVHKVIEVDRLYAQQTGAETAIALDHDQNISVLNIQQRIFADVLKPVKRSEFGMPIDASISTQIDTQEIKENDATEQEIGTFSTPQYLILVYSLQGDVVGLPIDGAPALQRFAESAFKPLSALYQQEGGIRCISGLILPTAGSPPIFLLNLAQVLQPPSVLLGAGQQTANTV